MKKLLFTLLTTASLSVFAGTASDIATSFNNSSTPAELVESGWALNNGDKNHKVLQIKVDDTGSTYELHIDKTGSVVASFDTKTTENLNFDHDYIMSSSRSGWAEMGTGENGPMYHMMPWVGKLSFKGPMNEAMNNMGPFASFLILIGTNAGK